MAAEPNPARRRPRGRLAEVAARRRTPASWLRALGRQWPLLLCLAVVVTGLVIAQRADFAVGCLVIGAGIGLAAVLRAALPERWVGLLCVRSRGLDVFLLAGLAVAIVVATLIVPMP